ncbi:MAG: hypothetical protein ABW217_07545 [Polyangiaceae bacterium]
MSTRGSNPPRLEQGWARSLLKGVKKRLRDLRALVQGMLGKLAPDSSLGHPARRGHQPAAMRGGLFVGR